jgi:hypothetical protein
MRLGSPPDARTNPAENPTVLLIEDHERLWAEISPPGPTRRFPDLLRVVQASHAALEKLSEHPNAVVTEIKSLPERVFALDQSPQLRDREKRADFLLDEPRVRMVVRAYGYLLGRAINRPGQEVFLRYWLTYPAEFDERARKLLVDELRAGILLSIPEGIRRGGHVRCRPPSPRPTPPRCAPSSPRTRPSRPSSRSSASCASRSSTSAAAPSTSPAAATARRRPRRRPPRAAPRSSRRSRSPGDDHLGGDYLTHELVWLTHQHPEHLPEMEAKEVPMQRPVTIPENKLARAPQLYKRSLAARQNKVRFQDELALEQVKFKRANEMARVDSLVARGSTSPRSPWSPSRPTSRACRSARARTSRSASRDGARQLASMIASTPWEPGARARNAGRAGGASKGVVILLAGNSSRSEYVERALAQALDAPDLKVWHPSDAFAPQGVVRYETPSRIERGAEILGVTPKTAVALGALRIANRDVHLVRAAQGFSYFVGDLRGFPPKFTRCSRWARCPRAPSRVRRPLRRLRPVERPEAPAHRQGVRARSMAPTTRGSSPCARRSPPTRRVGCTSAPRRPPR